MNWNLLISNYDDLCCHRSRRDFKLNAVYEQSGCPLCLAAAKPVGHDAQSLLLPIPIFLRLSYLNVAQVDASHPSFVANAVCSTGI